jgi:hypothetical protein
MPKKVGERLGEGGGEIPVYGMAARHDLGLKESDDPGVDLAGSEGQ